MYPLYEYLNSKMKMILPALIIGWTGLPSSSQGVRTSSDDVLIKNEVLVTLRPGATEHSLKKDLTAIVNVACTTASISEVMRLYEIEFSEDIDGKALSQIQGLPQVESAYFNEKLSNRVTPNDTYFGNQWSPEFIEITKVWNTTTGGKTFGGKEIVVAVLDDGFDLQHPDLKKNFYLNPHEIAGDGIDNDGNGYVDDISGINAELRNNAHAIKDHGTWVASILGAEGDNNTGIAGINWKIKILPISGIVNKGSIIRAYDYIYKMRKEYNESNGQKGAYILVANYSGGIDKQFGTDPSNIQWCNFYDLLGLQGVLSVGATTNTDTNVEVEGDMPSTCSSDYLIAVTNVNQMAVKPPSAGYGDLSIDLAAPGENIYGAERNGTYGFMFGTSSSSPHVAGTAALLFSVPCQGMQNLLDNDRVQAIEYVRDAILNSVKKSSNFAGITRTGGYLNTFSALLEMQDVCDNTLQIASPKGDLSIQSIRDLGVGIQVNYLSPDERPLTLMWSDASGKILKRETINPPQFGDKTFISSFSPSATAIYFLTLHDNNKSIDTEKVFLSPR